MIKKCLVCGKEFIDRTDNHSAKYCSSKCKNYHSNSIRKGYAKKWHEKNRERRHLMSKQQYETNKAEITAHRKARKEKLKEEFLSTYKRGKKCEICGWNEHPEILQFHHKDRKTKKFTIGNIAITERTTPKNIELVKQEINKCFLLCPNCHAILHLKERKK